jgi:hypothetical protein
LFAADTPLPTPVEIYLPVRVGQPSAVAYVGEGGQTFIQEHTTRVEDESLVVSFELATLGFQIEYYDTLPVDSAGQRTYDYVYTADYASSDLNLEFQVPPTAEDFVLKPAADLVTQKSDSLTYHLAQVGPVEQGETNGWTFVYQKADSDLTDPGPVQPETSQSALPATAEDTGNSTIWIFLVAFVALLGVGVAAFWLGRRAQPPPPPALRHKRRGSGRGEQPPTQRGPLPSSQGAFFCHKCGAELRYDSEFCHRCGTPVRTG